MFPRLRQNRIRRALREYGEDIGHSDDVLDAVCAHATAETVKSLKASLPAALVASAPKGVFDDGEHPILTAIAEWLRTIGEWLKSPDGQAFIAAIFKAILAAILAMGTVSIMAS
jgi:hypothetical protein